MKKYMFLTILLLGCALYVPKTFTAARARVGVEVGSSPRYYRHHRHDHGPVYSGDRWRGPGVYWGIWIDTRHDYHYLRRRHRGYCSRYPGKCRRHHHNW